MSEEPPPAPLVDTREHAPRDQRAGYLEQWGGVVEGVVTFNVDELHRKLMDAISAPVPRTGSAIDGALETVAGLFVEAHRLAERARADYEALKEDHEVWLEAKRTAARLVLEAEKKEGQLKKQITETMVMDHVRGAWLDEFSKRAALIRRVAATVHTLEAFPEAIKLRARALDARKDLVLATAPGR